MGRQAGGPGQCVQACVHTPALRARRASGPDSAALRFQKDTTEGCVRLGGSGNTSSKPGVPATVGMKEIFPNNQDNGKLVHSQGDVVIFRPLPSNLLSWGTGLPKCGSSFLLPHKP